jgi:hypothetical protein
MYHIRPPLIFGVKPFCHSHFSGKLTVKGLCYTYLNIMLSVHICRMGSYYMFRSKYLRATFKFLVPEWWNETSSTLRTQNSGVTLNLNLVVTLNVHALIITFFTQKHCNNYADDIRCHHIKFSLPGFVHPAILSYRGLHFSLNNFPLHYEAVAVTHS